MENIRSTTAQLEAAQRQAQKSPFGPASGQIGQIKHNVIF
jgi:hypothetical protein